MLDALTDNPQDFVNVSGTALAAGVCIEKRREIPAASAVPLTEPGAVLLEAHTKPGQAPSQIHHSMRFLLRPGASPGFVRRFYATGSPAP